MLEAYDDDGYQVHYKSVDAAAEAVRLPEATAAEGVIDVIRRRSSCRRYTRCECRSCSSRRCSPAPTHACASSFSRAAWRWMALARSLRRRPPPPSSSIRLEDVDGVADGVYHYDVLDTASSRSASEGMTTSWGPALAQPFLENANVLVFISAVFDRTLAKYGPRGYRYVLLEAGHLAQNLCLLAAERSLGSLCVGGFMDTRTNAFLGLDPRVEGVVYCVGVGTPEPPPA